MRYEYWDRHRDCHWPGEHRERREHCEHCEHPRHGGQGRECSYRHDHDRR